jgi:hypothetical protein
MEKQIAEIIGVERPTLSEMSIKTYSNSIYKLLELLKGNQEDLWKDSAKVISTLRKHYDKPNTIKTKLASVVVFLRCIKPKVKGVEIDKAIQAFSDEIEGLNSEVKQALSGSVKSDAQRENWVTDGGIKEIDEKLESLVPKTIQTTKDLMALRNLVIFRIYQDNPSRNDYADAKIVYRPTAKGAGLSDEYNWIVLDKTKKTGTYIMNQYKTAKSYGQKVVPLSPGLFSLLLRYKKAIDSFSEVPWFLLNDSGKGKMSRNRLGVVYGSLGAVIGKKLGTSLNRHIQLSSLIPVEAIKAMTDKMGNSPAEALAVYAKI